MHLMTFNRFQLFTTTLIVINKMRLQRPNRLESRMLDFTGKTEV